MNRFKRTISNALLATLVGLGVVGGLAATAAPASAGISQVCNNSRSQGNLGVQSRATGSWSSLRPGQCANGKKAISVPRYHHGHYWHGQLPAGYTAIGSWIGTVTVHDNH